MKFGAHVSIAGGIANAPLNAAAIGCEVFQIFSRSPQGGPAPAITRDIAELFQKRCNEHGLSQWVIHAPYYINFASGEERTRSRSTAIIREELERGTLIGASYVMFHPGSSKDVGDEKALAFCIEGITNVLNDYSGSTRLLIELSAGAGSVIGDTFEEVAAILDGIGHPELGVCFDTAHAFASGYDLRDEKSVRATFKKFDETIGLARLAMSHCNDSKVGLGEKKDRHEHLGKGFIGVEGFRAIVRHPKLQSMNLFLETEPNGVKDDLKILRSFRDSKTT